MEDGYGGDHADPYATYSLNGHSTLPDGYNPGACPDDSPINTVEAYSRAHDVSVCVSITGPSAGRPESEGWAVGVVRQHRLRPRREG